MLSGVTIWPSNPTPPKRKETNAHTETCTGMFMAAVLNSQKLETTQMTTKRDCELMMKYEAERGNEYSFHTLLGVTSRIN